MDELIYRQDAIRWVKTNCNPYGKPTLDYDSGIKVINHLEKMTSVDAVEVVRCKDCIHNQYGFCEKVNHNTGYVSTCADVLRAEKRENDG